MQTIFVGLVSGLIVGVICVAYVLLRTTKLFAAHLAAHSAAKHSGAGTLQAMPESAPITSPGLMFMAIFGSGSLLWGFLGAGIYHLIRDDERFFVLSLALAAGVITWIWLSKTSFAIDKMILTLFIFIGLGVLIPWMI